MERTQIYLTRAQASALDREARRRRTTRSHLIREAIDERYLTPPHQPELLAAALRDSAGAWKERTETGADYVERIRSGRRLRRAWRQDGEGDTA